MSAEISIMPSRAMFTTPDKSATTAPRDANKIGVVTRNMDAAKDAEKTALRSGCTLLHLFQGQAVSVAGKESFSSHQQYDHKLV